MNVERQVRLLLRAFPSGWRETHADEIVATVLDGLPPGQRRLGVDDAVDLIRGGMVLRARCASRACSPAVPTAAAVLLALATVVGVALTVGPVSPEFLATSMVVIVIPGTGVVYTVSQALTAGTRRGVVAAAGCTLGIVPHLMAATVGLSGVMQAGATAFEVVRWLGVGYLAWMGVGMLRDGGALHFPGPSDDGESVDAVPASTVIRRGVMLNLLNPKLTLFFFAFLPQFLETSPAPLDPALIGLGVVFMALTLAVFVVYAQTGAALRSRILTAPRVMRWIQRSLGALLVGFAARLAISD